MQTETNVNFYLKTWDTKDPTFIIYDNDIPYTINIQKVYDILLKNSEIIYKKSYRINLPVPSELFDKFVEKIHNTITEANILRNKNNISKGAAFGISFKKRFGFKGKNPHVLKNKNIIERDELGASAVVNIGELNGVIVVEKIQGWEDGLREALILTYINSIFPNHSPKILDFYFDDNTIIMEYIPSISLRNLYDGERDWDFDTFYSYIKESINIDIRQLGIGIYNRDQHVGNSLMRTPLNPKNPMVYNIDFSFAIFMSEKYNNEFVGIDSVDDARGFIQSKMAELGDSSSEIIDDYSRRTSLTKDQEDLLNNLLNKIDNSEHID